ncbi:site-specific integrase [Deinococcus pimensis]|uniref:site-specific integrase n=1 Tax=Deinococcus pimensis TaxID=309888 RepID=UPI0004AD45BE|nr:phage integrase N-terminal SAM-like domain-containing protein [Deinococcus pimensis]
MTDLVLASRWTNPDSRRREALRAAHTQDADVLTDLVTHHLRLRSRRAGDVSEATLRSYALAVRSFLDFTGPADAPRHALNQLGEDAIGAYVQSLRARGLEVGSVRTYLYGVRALFRALAWAGARRDDPTRDVRPPVDVTPAHTPKRAEPAERVKVLLALPG